MVVRSYSYNEKGIIKMDFIVNWFQRAARTPRMATGMYLHEYYSNYIMQGFEKGDQKGCRIKCERSANI